MKITTALVALLLMIISTHAFASTTQVGLIQTLYGNGLVGRQFLARPDCASVWRWLRLVLDLMVAWIVGALHIPHRRLRS